MNKSNTSIRGQVRLQAFDKDGKEKWDTGFQKNTITNLGLKAMCGLTGNIDSQTAFTYVAVGTSNTAPAATQTALVAEITDSGLARAAVTPTSETTTVTDDTLQLSKSFSVTGTKTVEEAGVFNDPTTGVMLARALTTSKSVVNGDTLVVTYQVIFA